MIDPRERAERLQRSNKRMRWFYLAMLVVTAGPSIAAMLAGRIPWFSLFATGVIAAVFIVNERLIRRMDRAFTLTIDAPRNVRVVYPDGRVVPLEMYYRGFDNGLHEWVATTTVPLAYGWKLQVDEVPARTAIIVRSPVVLVDDDDAYDAEGGDT